MALSVSARVSSLSFDFTQNTPTISWIINHNLGFNPIITVYSVGGSEMIAEIIHTSLNQAIVYFTTAQAGYARCV